MQLPMRIAGQSVITDAPQIVELPYDGSPVATIFRAGREHVDAAVRAARGSRL